MPHLLTSESNMTPPPPHPASVPFQSVDDALLRLTAEAYLPSGETVMAAFLMDRLEKPLLVEGPAGVGKTELARALAKALGRELVRLQCYEGLDEAKALYEWEYAKQLLYTQLLRDKIGSLTQGTQTLAEAADRLASEDAVFFSRRFLLPRPILQALVSERPALLLIDEVDKADPEFEAFLLEVLQDNAVTLPELGTIQAVHVPRVVLTSNAARELSDALRRRCLHLHLGYPSRDRELAILKRRLPGVADTLLSEVVQAVSVLRSMDLKKAPSLSETIDWALALVLLNADRLDAELVEQTLNVVLKHQVDVDKARGKLQEIAPS